MKIDPRLNLLVLEVDRQLRVLSNGEHGAKNRIAKRSVTILSEEDDGYRSCLVALRKEILSCPGR